uniref:Ig-like domain-containing protein n=1 Tax=Catharus ustulatus TaxID=91951 RepID=A0A8C3UE04_CATUS
MAFSEKKIIVLFSPTAAVARGQVQQEPSLETTEGTGVNISCSHSNIGTGDTIAWYRQLPEKGPEFLGSVHKEFRELPDIAGQLWVSADRRSSALWLRRPRRGDAAVYYCALVGDPISLGDRSL